MKTTVRVFLALWLATATALHAQVGIKPAQPVTGLKPKEVRLLAGTRLPLPVPAFAKRLPAINCMSPKVWPIQPPPYTAFFCKMELKTVHYMGVWIKVHAGNYDQYTAGFGTSRSYAP